MQKYIILSSGLQFNFYRSLIYDEQCKDLILKLIVINTTEL